ncbi:hypothetical protein VMCG_05144 [Cytospora schulzeri]|uniref:Uncharacterized protein n=1 Tax=Cytospora schulzeri TaxID=448051 RepID=A0A423WR33_9PEZI|nr:hypothetical protein VMCG_05144 [Valsa malicola]
MAYETQFHLPGEYHLSEPTTSSTTLNANLFRPPTSPTTSTYNLSKSTGSLLSDNTSLTTNNHMPIVGGKRTNDENKVTNTPNFFNNDSRMEDGARGQDRYTLAGQIDTPGAQPSSNGLLEDSLYSDIDYRRRLELGSKRPHDDSDTPSHGLSGLGIADPDTTLTPRAAGWTTFAFQAIGGVVGKVWDFCRGGTGTFRGFQAGGGKPYEPNGQPALTSAPANTANHFSPDTPVVPQEQETPASPPGAFPFTDMVSPTPDIMPVQHDPDHAHTQPNTVQDHHEIEQQREPSPDTTSERPAVKRRRTSGNWENDELRRHWVMVDEEEPSPVPMVHRPAPNTRRSSTMSSAASRLPTSGRTNVASRLQQPRLYSASSPLTTPDRRTSAPSPRFGFSSEQKSAIPAPRAPSRLSIGSNASFAGHIRSPAVVTADRHVRSPSAVTAERHVHSPTLVTAEPASYASPRSPQQPETPTFSPTGSRIPQPRGFGPNPFANIRPVSPAPRGTPSRPSSRQSVQPSPLTASFIPKSTPTSSHRRNASSISGRKSSTGVNTQASPRLDQQAKQLVTKKMAVDKKNDNRLDRLNGELQALIRQGQQALGTSFDVEMDEDERWDEE